MFPTTIPSPLLDLSRFDAATSSERTAFLLELREAARQVGFFYVTGHGVEPALLDGLMNSAENFFALPEPDKLAVGDGQFAAFSRLYAR